MIDTDNSGTITYEELKHGLKRVGSDLTESEIKALMSAVLVLYSISLLSIRKKFQLDYTLFGHLVVGFVE